MRPQCPRTRRTADARRTVVLVCGLWLELCWHMHTQLLVQNERYCHEHPNCKLRQITREDTSVPAYWKKVFMVNEALHHQGARCDTVLWLDRDAVISNRTERFDRFTHHE